MKDTKAAPTAKTAVLVNARQLATIADELEKAVRVIREAAEEAKRQPEESLAIFAWASANQGLERIRAFKTAADDSRVNAQLGNPIQAGVPKRPPAKAPRKAPKK